MSSAKVYRVSGTRRYRGHEPGTEFSALIDSTVEGRLIGRGVIEVVDGLRPMLERGSFRLPDGWGGDNGAARLTTLERRFAYVDEASL